MAKTEKKRSIFARFRNYFITGIFVLIPIGITVYITLFIVQISSKLLPKELNPNHYLPFDIPGIEILIAVIFISLIGCLSLSFLGRKIFDVIDAKNIVKYTVIPMGIKTTMPVIK